MTKRSALTLAGGVVAALAAAGTATVVNLGVLEASTPSEGPGNLRRDRPVVRTIEDTVTVHKTRDPRGRVTTVVSRPSPAPAAPPVAGELSPGDRGDDEHEEHEEYEEYEDEDEDEGTEDEESFEHEYDEEDDD